MRDELYPSQAVLSPQGRTVLPSSLRPGHTVMFPMIANSENPNGESDGTVLVEGVVRACIPMSRHPSANGRDMYYVKVAVFAGGGFDAFETARHFHNDLDSGILRTS